MSETARVTAVVGLGLGLGLEDTVALTPAEELLAEAELTVHMSHLGTSPTLDVAQHR